jgi:hypothetical protein
MSRDTTSPDWWTTVRAAFFTDAEIEPEPEPGLSAEDIDDMGLDEFGEKRAAMGIRHQAGDFIGLSSNDDDGSGFPSWRETPVHEQVEPTDLDRHIEAREAAGIKTASAVFGVNAAQPRSHSSPYSI